jgi:opacity protein-like surface antigen
VNRTQRSLLRIAAACALLAAASSAASAQELYTFTASALGGVGGSFDADPGNNTAHPSYQLGFSVVTEPQTMVGFRVGRIDFGSDQLGNLVDAGLDYFTVAGEYRFDEELYDSGIYLGVGAYRLSGTRLTGGSGDESGLGVVVGVTGEFTINRHFGVLLEFSGHYANLDQAQFYAMAHGGLAFHF